MRIRSKQTPMRYRKNPQIITFQKKIKYVQLKLDYEYPAGLLPLQKLKEHGLGQVQIQARPDRNLRNFLEAADRALMGGDETDGQ